MGSITLIISSMCFYVGVTARPTNPFADEHKSVNYKN